MSSLIEACGAPFLGSAAHDEARDADQSPRDRASRLLKDPKGYFADARSWAGKKAKADVQRELSEKKAQRTRLPLWSRLRLAAVH
ncbi:hypothetical protein [Actinocatenispora comari]|uniref:Uncharacterized protein n=1 Tax=Actinocatenispora comari TaxID=2807577 RepID=A0A8J4EMQ9_9ACTN|nr:hypothetical protein [Actinocatenispora comari]GIL30652.1 hypothetical protein NUM_59060 [Actinocatenispora comari]